MGLMQNLKSKAKKIFKRFSSPETDALYKILYDQVHDLNFARELTPNSTRSTFSHQWESYPEGEYLLSDPWFRANVDRILTEQEILLRPEWFNGRKVLDAGCGNGRWAYGFCKLGADLTCVDQSEQALNSTRHALQDFKNPTQFVRSPLENLREVLPERSFDLVFSWGVLHHCSSYNESLANVASMVSETGILYLYLYGRESVSMEEDIRLFKKRVAYNVLFSDVQKYQFLLKQAKGDKNKVHTYHDIYAPLVNRRFTFEEVAEQLTKLGFKNVTRTIRHSEVFVRATRGDARIEDYSLPPKEPPYWFQGHHI